MKIENNVIDWILDGITAAICFFTALFLLLRWSKLPEQVPSHYKMDGSVDGYSGKSSLIILLAVACLAGIIFTILLRFPKTWNLPCKVTENNSYIVYRITKYWLSIVRIILTASLASLVWFVCMLKPLPSWWNWAELGSLMTVSVIGILVTNAKAKKYS